jgi:hypothetical protein
MKSRFTGLVITLGLILCYFASSYAQGETQKGASAAGTQSGSGITAALTTATAPVEPARAALAAQGGEKFRTLKSMVLRGSVDLYPPNSTQSIPGNFVLVTAGDKLRIEIDARPAISFKQIYDGQQTYSSVPGVQLPPASKFGLMLLTRFEQPGYSVTALPDKKKQRGFRIADSEGNTTDFYVDPATARVMTFTVGYNGYTFGTENRKFKEVEGVLVPYSFTQRLELPQGAFLADYSVKDVKLNQPIGDDVFAMP